MTTAPLHPGLDPAPALEVGPTDVRSRLAVALAHHGATVPVEVRGAVAAVLAETSPVAALTGALALLGPLTEPPGAPEPPLHPVLLARAVELAELCGRFAWSPDPGAALALAARLRAALQA